MTRVNTLLLMVAFGVLSPAAQAHLLKVFAFAEGNRIEGATYFVGGTPASGASVEVMSADGRLLATLVPDTDGEFSYQTATREDHVIIANTGDGHVARWTVSAAELTGKESSKAGENTHHAPPSATTGPVTEPGNNKLAALVESAVARQVQPLREQIARYEDRIRLRDIIGGIGYIVGLSGLAIWWRQRRRSGS